jgi:RHS repeat-associated protein
MTRKDTSFTPNLLYSDTYDEPTTKCVNATLLAAGTCSGTGALNPTSKTTRDIFGRVTKVIEPSNDATTYSYHVNGKVSFVTQGGRNRSFVYDGAGNLTAEQTPEKGLVEYLRYGSHGNPIKIKEGQNGSATQQDEVIRFLKYDFAGRLLCDEKTVAGSSEHSNNCDTAPGTVYVRHFYDGNGFPGGFYPLGKLTRRTGTNPFFKDWQSTPADMTVRVVEDLDYSHPSGRLSTRTTSIKNLNNAVSGANTPAVEGFGYDALGLLNFHVHARVVGSFNVSTTYTAGLPTQIVAAGVRGDGGTFSQNVVTDVTYDPTGSVASYATDNSTADDVITQITRSPGLVRPTRIHATLGESPMAFDTGTYSYDGAGNILSMPGMGGATFTYDNRSRLRCSTLDGSARQHDYDRWGNLTKKCDTALCTSACPTTWSISGNNQISNSNYEYDLRGNLERDGTTGSAQSHFYDALNRQVRHVVGSVDWNYAYDGAGERTIRSPRSFPATVPRREVARYVLQAREAKLGEAARSTASCSGGNLIPDVPCADSDWSYIRKFMSDGYSAGCGGGAFCPDNLPMTRDQMAVFLVKARYGPTHVPPICTTQVFSDVPCSSPFAPWINQLVADGVTAGCGGGNYCPTAQVTEFQMQAFIGYNGYFNLKPVPAGTTYTFRDEGNRVATEFLDSVAVRDNVYLGNLLVGSYVSSPLGGNEGWNFYSSDHLGTPRLATKLNADYVDPAPFVRTYWPYGEEKTTAANSQRMRFANMERDTEGNRYFDHARHHDQRLGRFLAPDLIQGAPHDPQTWNRYAYSLSNPTRNIDPNGRQTYTAFYQHDPTWAKNFQADLIALGRWTDEASRIVLTATFIAGGGTVAAYAAPAGSIAIALFGYGLSLGQGVANNPDDPHSGLRQGAAVGALFSMLGGASPLVPSLRAAGSEMSLELAATGTVSPTRVILNVLPATAVGFHVWGLRAAGLSSPAIEGAIETYMAFLTFGLLNPQLRVEDPCSKPENKCGPYAPSP